MRHLFVAAAFAALACAQPSAAAPVTQKVTGVVSGFRYGEAAANDLFAVVPVGSVYSFTFSYDTAMTPTSSSPGFGIYPPSANYSGVPINGSLSLGGVSFGLPIAYLNSGGGPFDGAARFSVHENAPFSQARLAGYQLSDFSMQLFDSSGQAVRGELPAVLDVGDFDRRYFDLNFSFGPNGFTGLRLSIDRIANVAAVPEPAAWLIIIAGFVMIGARLRRSGLIVRA